MTVGTTEEAVIREIEAKLVSDRSGCRERDDIRYCCTEHDDKNPSARWNVKKRVFHCDVCQAGGGWKDLASRLGIELPAATGCTLAEYADAKKLPEDFLRSVDLRDYAYFGTPSVRIPYLDELGGELAVRYRIGLHKTPGDGDRFRWNKGAKVRPYGLWRLEDARARGRVVLCEGESDAQTLWFHDFPALGIPGAGNWQPAWDTTLDGIDAIYVVIEPDQGGDAIQKWIASSSIRERARLLRIPPVNEQPCKDPSALHLADQQNFKASIEKAMADAVPWQTHADEQRRAETDAAWETCRTLAHVPNVLAELETALTEEGFCGDMRPAKILYLATTSRVLDRPVSVAVKGPSSAGKSYTTESVLSFFPASAFYTLTAMSERALAYGEEPLKNRMLVMAEAAGTVGDILSYLLRSLLSEGRIRYEFVEKTKDGLKNRLVEREGPTGLIVTTTAVRLHPENETRLFSLTISDSRAGTAQVLRSLAREDHRRSDRSPWLALQEWIAGQPTRVTIPYAEVLATLMPAVAVRLRRDLRAVLQLIRAHAVLHQASRERDERGWIIATWRDYAVVAELVSDVISEGVEASVSSKTRETVEAVARVLAGKDGDRREATITEVAQVLEVDRSAASRRVNVALGRGFLRNDEQNPRRPKRLTLGEPMPEDLVILPSVETLTEACKRALETEGYEAASLSDDEWGEVEAR